MVSFFKTNNKIKSVLERIILTGLFLAVFVPIMVILTQLAYPTITVKAFAFRAIVEIIFFSWSILALLDTKYWPKSSIIAIGLTVFVFTLMIADMLGVMPRKSFWSDFTRMEGWILIIHLWAYFVVMISVLRKEIWWIRIFNTSIFVAILITGFAFLQITWPKQFHYNTGGRIDGLFGNSSYLSIYLVLHIFICIFLLFRPKIKNGLKAGYGLYAFLLSLPLFYTGTRGAILGLVLGISIAVLLCMLFDRQNKVTQKTGMIVLSLIFVSIACLYVARNTQLVKENLFLSRTASLFNSKVGGDRYQIWRMAIEGISEKPILGWGQENFNYIFNKYYTPEYQQEEWFDRSHNVFLEWLVVGGIVTFISYCSLYGIAIKCLWKGNHGLTVVQKSVLSGMMVAYVVHNCFLFDHLQSYIIFMIFLAYTHFIDQNCSDTTSETKTNCVSIKKNKATIIGKETVIPENQNSIIIILLVSSVIFLITINLIVVKPFLACHAMYQAMTATQGREKLLFYKKALGYKTAYAEDILIVLVGDTGKIIGALRGKEAEDAKSYFKNELEQLVSEMPNDPKPNLFLSIYLGEIGLLEDAEKYARRAVEMSPNKQSFLFNLGQICFTNKKYDAAYEAYKQAYELNTILNMDYAIRSYAKISIFIGRGNEVYEIVKPYMKEQNIDQSVVGAFLSSDANKALMVDFYERIKQEDPNNMITRVYLVNAYAHVDEKKKAYSEIEEMKRDFPQIRKELDNLATEVYRFKPVSGAPATEGSPPLIEKYVPKKVESDF